MARSLITLPYLTSQSRRYVACGSVRMRELSGSHCSTVDAGGKVNTCTMYWVYDIMRESIPMFACELFCVRSVDRKTIEST